MGSKRPASAELADTSRLLEEGNIAYNNKRHRDALEIFNQALTSANSQPSIQLQILDHLVGVHVKLRDLDLALITAKSMVRCDRSDSRGYLRCGQVKRLEDDHKAACKWYEHGLKNVKSSDRLRQSLQSSLNKSLESVRNKRVHSRPRDPMTYLPSELVHVVLAHLDYKEHTKLLRVCKIWKQLLSSLPPITNTIDFSYTKQQISWIALRAAVRRLHNYPTKVVISKLSNTALSYLNERLELWSKKPTIQCLAMNNSRIHLKELCLQSTTLRTLMLGHQVNLSSSDFETILRHCHNLSTLTADTSSLEPQSLMQFESSFRQEQLRTLIVRTNVQFQTLSCFPNLVHLEYRRMHSFRRQVELDLTSNAELRYAEISAAGVFTKLPLGIETFKNRTAGGFAVDKDSNLFHLELCFDARSLQQYVSLMQPDALAQIQTFALEFDHKFGTFNRTDLDLLFNQCSGFRHIRIKSELFEDADLCGMVGKVPNLRSLQIENARVTGAFLADILKTQPCRIESISLRACSNVSPDTWDWMRQRGISVDVRNRNDISPIYGGHRLVDLR